MPGVSTPGIFFFMLFNIIKPINMATAIRFEEQNDWIGKPEDMSNNQCYALPVCRFITHIPGVIDRAPNQRVWAHASFWQLSDEEIDEIVRTRGVWTKTIGLTTYPMSVHGIKPIHPGDGGVFDQVFTTEEIQKLKQQTQP